MLVEVIWGVEGGYDENDEIESGIYVMILNPSINTTIHVSGISFLYPWRKSNILNILIDNLKYNRFSLTYGWVYGDLKLFKFDDGCPLSIEPGNRHKILIPDKIINKILEDSVDRKIMFSVSDQLGNEVLSKPYEPPSEIH